jgi:GNAT superfamily N-acetyltransferase
LGLRPLTPADIPAVFEIRTAVSENAISMERLAEVGITPASVLVSLGKTRRGWVTENEDGMVVAFVMVELEKRSVLGLFTRPGWENRGCGTTLIRAACDCLFELGAQAIWLTTGSDTPAADFYRRRGWRAADGPTPTELRFEYDRERWLAQRTTA